MYSSLNSLHRSLSSFSVGGDMTLADARVFCAEQPTDDMCYPALLHLEHLTELFEEEFEMKCTKMLELVLKNHDSHLMKKN